MNSSSSNVWSIKGASNGSSNDSPYSPLGISNNSSRNTNKTKRKREAKENWTPEEITRLLQLIVHVLDRDGRLCDTTGLKADQWSGVLQKFKEEYPTTKKVFYMVTML